MREEARGASRQPHHIEQARDAFPYCGGGKLLVLDERLGDDVADPHARVERGVGILENCLDRFPVIAAAGGVEFFEVAPVE